jgi:hypothetical protein
MQLVKPNRHSRFCRRLIMSWVIAVAATCALAAYAAAGDVVDHAFSFNTRYDNQDAAVLDYRYGESSLPVRAPEQAVREGKALMSTNVNGPMLRGDSLYVKWRNERTGQVYEDTVDLRQRLPAEIAGCRIHFIIRGSQLYVYLISPEPAAQNTQAIGPRMYRDLKSTLIYPDKPKS